MERLHKLGSAKEDESNQREPQKSSLSPQHRPGDALVFKEPKWYHQQDRKGSSRIPHTLFRCRLAGPETYSHTQKIKARMITGVPKRRGSAILHIINTGRKQSRVAAKFICLINSPPHEMVKDAHKPCVCVVNWKTTPHSVMGRHVDCFALKSLGPCGFLSPPYPWPASSHHWLVWWTQIDYGAFKVWEHFIAFRG